METAYRTFRFWLWRLSCYRNRDNVAFHWIRDTLPRLNLCLFSPSFKSMTVNHSSCIICAEDTEICEKGVDNSFARAAFWKQYLGNHKVCSLMMHIKMLRIENSFDWYRFRSIVFVWKFIGHMPMGNSQRTLAFDKTYRIRTDEQLWFWKSWNVFKNFVSRQAINTVPIHSQFSLVASLCRKRCKL